MPEISRFSGIVIKMFFHDHNPLHFHAEYGDNAALIDIRACHFFPDGCRLACWVSSSSGATLHRQELLDDWEKAKLKHELQKIAPLE